MNHFYLIVYRTGRRDDLCVVEAESHNEAVRKAESFRCTDGSLSDARMSVEYMGKSGQFATPRFITSYWEV